MTPQTPGFALYDSIERIYTGDKQARRELLVIYRQMWLDPVDAPGQHGILSSPLQPIILSSGHYRISREKILEAVTPTRLGIHSIRGGSKGLTKAAVLVQQRVLVKKCGELNKRGMKRARESLDALLDLPFTVQANSDNEILKEYLASVLDQYAKWYLSQKIECPVDTKRMVPLPEWHTSATDWGIYVKEEYAKDRVEPRNERRYADLKDANGKLFKQFRHRPGWTEAQAYENVKKAP